MSDAPWLLLLYSLPAGRSSARVGVWRKLKKSGALPFKTSAYLLPNRPDLAERFEWLAQEIRDAGGESSLIRVAELGGVTDEEVIRQFQEARDAEYDEIAGQLNELIRRMKKSAEPGLQRELEKLRRQFVEVQNSDFFESLKGQEVTVLFERALLPDTQRKGKISAILSPRRYSNQTWLTRPRPAIDRVGSAWLIQRFIDPKARFVFSEDPGSLPEAIPYDMTGVEFGHQGEDCTFETLLKRFGFRDKILRKLGEMIHDADLDDGKFQAVEAIGLDRVFKGWSRLGVADEEIFSRGFECFGALYEQLKAKR
jgi:hypothetical protein